MTQKDKIAKWFSSDLFGETISTRFILLPNEISRLAFFATGSSIIRDIIVHEPCFDPLEDFPAPCLVIIDSVTEKFRTLDAYRVATLVSSYAWNLHWISHDAMQQKHGL